MILDLNKAGGGYKQTYLPPMAELREQLRDKSEALFRDYWGEPERTSGNEWRAKQAKTARAMVMRGHDRGAWTDHKSGESGGPMEFLAIYALGLSGMPTDNDGKRALRTEAASWLGIDVSKPVSEAELELRRAERAHNDAQRVKAAEAHDEAERRKNAAVVAAVRAAARPIEGTPAEIYLRSRGIEQWPADAVAYVPPGALHFKKGIKDGEHGALLIWGSNDAGEIVAGQRVLIDSKGQRIDLVKDQDGKLVKAVKPSFAEIGGAPARLPARGDSTDLIVAEGPETALAIWQAVGCEVWAVFGVSGFMSAPLPFDRKVILAPDQDPPDSPAAAAFEKALAHHSARHPDLWVARAPEPIGSTDDLNDTLMRAGPDAVLAAVAGAVRCERAAPEAAWGDATHLASEGSVSDARRLSDEVFDRWIDNTHAFDPDAGQQAPIQGLRVPTGVGKSFAAREAAVRLARDLAAKKDPRSVVIFVPTHALGTEYIEEINCIAGGISVEVYRGRDRADPRAEGEKMCRRADEAIEVQRAGAEVDSTLCKAGSARYAFYEVCGYLRQKKATARIWIVPHALLWRAPPPQIKPAAVVVDEDATGGALKGFDGTPALLSLDDLTRPLKIDKDPESSRQLASLSARVADVLRASGKRINVEALRDAGLTPTEMAEASRMAFQAKQTLEAGPSSTTEKLRAELARVAPINRLAFRKARLFGIIANAMKAALVTVPGLLITPIKTEDGGEYLAVRLRWCEEVRSGWNVPTLLASATAQPEMLRAVWPGLGEVISAEAATPHVSVRQITDRSFGASSICPSDDATPEAQRHAASTRAKLRRYIEVRQAEFGGRALHTGQKDYIERQKAEGLPSNIETGHFNALAGIDRWRDVRLLVQVGRTMPPPETVEDMAEVLTFKNVERIEGWYPLVADHLDMHGSGKGPAVSRARGNGQAPRVGTERHPDPMAEAIRWSICEGEALQSAGRGRGVNRTEDTPLQIDIICAMPLGLAVDEAGTFESFEPSAADVMAARGFVVPDTSAKGAWHVVAAILPDLFGSADAARMAFERSREHNPIGTLIGKRSRESGKAEIRLEGARYAVLVFLRAKDKAEALALLACALPSAELRSFEPPQAGETHAATPTPTNATRVTPTSPPVEHIALGRTGPSVTPTSPAQVVHLDQIRSEASARMALLLSAQSTKTLSPDLEAMMAKGRRRARALYSPRCDTMADVLEVGTDLFWLAATLATSRPIVCAF